MPLLVHAAVVLDGLVLVSGRAVPRVPQGRGWGPGGVFFRFVAFGDLVGEVLDAVDQAGRPVVRDQVVIGDLGQDALQGVEGLAALGDHLGLARVDRAHGHVAGVGWQEAIQKVSPRSKTGDFSAVFLQKRVVLVVFGTSSGSHFSATGRDLFFGSVELLRIQRKLMRLDFRRNTKKS